MKHILPLLLCGAFCLVGCEEEPSVPPAPTPEPTVEVEPVAADETESSAETSLKDVTDAAGSYASQQADKVAAASKETLDDMEAKFEELKVAAAEQGEVAKTKFAEMKAKFDAKMADAETKLDEFKEANAPRAEQIQKDLSSAMDEAGAILKDAWSRFGAGEAPAEEAVTEVEPTM